MQITKDVLEFTTEELEALSIDDLKELETLASNKEAFWNTRQLVEKLLINSLYGALANRWFSLFNEDMACAITGNGRYFIRKLAIYIEKELQKLLPQDKPYIVYGDTDSIYYTISSFMSKYQTTNPDLSMDEYVDWADSFEKKIIAPIIQKCINDFSEELNAFNSKVIGAEREIIADETLFTAKKKYLARVRDSEGTRFPTNSPYIKVMGLEIAKSSTPKWSLKYLKDAIPLILDKEDDDIRQWIKSIKQEFTTVDLNQIASNAGVSNLDYILGSKGVPIGSRSALIHNKYIKDNNLEDKYQEIQPGDKTKRLYLIEPNPFGSNIIAYTNDSFIKEIQGFVDYDTNFEKNFIKPLILMVQCLDYNLKKETASLDDW